MDRDGASYRPSLSVVTVFVSFVPTLVTVTVALGTTAPLTSCTTPVIVQVFDCAKAAIATAIKMVAIELTHLIFSTKQFILGLQIIVKLLCNRLLRGFERSR